MPSARTKSTTSRTSPQVRHTQSPACEERGTSQVRDTQVGEPAVEATANDPVVGIVRFEEERLTRRQCTERTATAGPPEVDLAHVGTRGEEPKPIAVSNTDVRLHDQDRTAIQDNE